MTTIFEDNGYEVPEPLDENSFALTISATLATKCGNITAIAPGEMRGNQRLLHRGSFLTSKIVEIFVRLKTLILLFAHGRSYSRPC